MGGSRYTAPTADERGGLLRVLYLTVFLTSTGLGTTTFLLPVYASGMGADYVDLGLMGAARNMVYALATLTVGYLLDRFERVRIYAVFMAFAAAVVALFGAMEHVPELILWNVPAGLSSASFWVTASTLTADISPPERLTQSMGRYNMSWILGFIVGPYIGGVISDAFGFRVLFLFLSTLILCSVVLILVRIRPAVQLRNRGASKGINLASLRGLSIAYLTLVPFSMILGIYMSIVPGYLRAVGLTSALIGFLITMTNGVRGLGFFNSNWFVSQGVRRSVTLASLLIFGGMLVFSFAGSMVEYAIPLAMYGAAAGIMTPLMLDYIAKRCDKSALGAAMGMHESVYGVGMLLGPALGGAVADAYGPAVLYRLLAALALTLLPLAWLLGRNEAPRAS
jgi:MFS family permease